MLSVLIEQKWWCWNDSTVVFWKNTSSNSYHRCCAIAIRIRWPSCWIIWQIIKTESKHTHLKKKNHQRQVCIYSTHSGVSHVCHSLVDFSVQMFSFVSHFQRHLACLWNFTFGQKHMAIGEYVFAICYSPSLQTEVCTQFFFFAQQFLSLAPSLC